MDKEIWNRLEFVWKKLDVDGCCKSGINGRDEKVRKVLKKWRYRSRRASDGCKAPWNRFLPQKLQRLTPLYDDMVQVASLESHGVRLRDLQGLLERCRRLQEGAKSTPAAWDDQWINPLSLASKGWDFGSVDEKKRIICTCHSCRRTLLLDLGFDQCSSQYLRKSYWIHSVSSAHGPRCPWKDAQFDVEKDYRLHKWNLVHDIERISTELSQSSKVSMKKSSQDFLPKSQFSSLKQVFHYHGEDQRLELLLRGFQPMMNEPDVVKCSACFRKVFTSNLAHLDLSYHEPWCRYRQERLLAEMILSPINVADFEEQDNVTKRLHKLETYLEGL